MPKARKYGMEIFFLPKNPSLAKEFMARFMEECTHRALYFIVERDVPVDHSVHGRMAL